MAKNYKELAEGFARGGWKKFSRPTASRGGTAYPMARADQERMGMRADYDDSVEKDGEEHHNFKVQLNAGKVPYWVEVIRIDLSTNGTWAHVLIKKGATQEEVHDTLLAAFKKE